MTIQISGRKLLVGVLAIMMIAAAGYIAFLVGQMTRITEADATARTNTQVERAIERTVEADVKKADARVAATKRADNKRLDTRVHRLNKMWRGRLSRAKDEARRAGEAAGYSSGQSEGYSSGQSAGFSSGHSAGVDEGIEQASDELDCSDDLDVPLPFC